MENLRIGTPGDVASRKSNQKLFDMKKGRGIALGLILGTALGVATDNLGLWLSMGIVFGAAYDSQLVKKRSSKET